MTGEKKETKQSVTLVFLPPCTKDLRSIPDSDLSKFPISFLSIHERFVVESRTTGVQLTRDLPQFTNGLIRNHE